MKKIYTVAAAALIATASFAQQWQEPLTEQPAGKVYKDLYRTSAGYYVFWGEINYGVNDGILGEFVEGDDGAFYIKNPISTLETGSWIKGVRGQGDTICVELPQVIYKDMDEDTTVYMSAYKMEYYQDEEGRGYRPSASQTMKFVWRNDSLTKVDEEMIGLGDAADSVWYGFGDLSFEMHVQKEKPVAPLNPEQADTCSMVYAVNDSVDDALLVRVAVDGGDIYMQHFAPNQPEAWIKGRIEGDKAVFDARQYLGIDTVYGNHTYFMPVGVKPVWNIYNENYEDSVYGLGRLVFDYDVSAKTLRTDSGLVINYGWRDIEYRTLYKSMRIAQWSERPLTPSDPVFTEYEPFDEAYGYGIIKYDISKFSTTGEVMDPDKLYYNIYYDDELETFYPDEYTALKEEMTNIPCTFKDSWDFYLHGINHSFYFQAQGVDRIGIQLVYTGGGETHKSNLVYTDGSVVSAVKSAVANGLAGEMSVSYTDLCGRQVEKPTKGIYLKTINYADGTKKSVKTVVR